MSKPKRVCENCEVIRVCNVYHSLNNLFYRLEDYQHSLRLWEELGLVCPLFRLRDCLKDD